jgi:hypothetical protein
MKYKIGQVFFQIEGNKIRRDVIHSINTSNKSVLINGKLESDIIASLALAKKVLLARLKSKYLSDKKEVQLISEGTLEEEAWLSASGDMQSKQNPDRFINEFWSKWGKMPWEDPFLAHFYENLRISHESKQNAV